MKPTQDDLAFTSLTQTAAAEETFHIEEATIPQIHCALKTGKISCIQLVDAYLTRIDAYDKKGPALNAVLTINQTAREIAATKDAEFEKTGALSGPLHCIPIAAKDNYNTTDMPTTGGSEALKGVIPPKESTVTKKLRDAGAVIIVKTNMHELALSGTTVSSLGGQTKNPYDLTRTPGGSSGGTGVAIAANFASVGLGSDTVNSIRSPASANALVGFRPTMGLVSRAGVMPVSSTQDVVGPIARTVTDAAIVLDNIAGFDAEDALTARAVGKIPKTYTSSLDRNGLKGARIAVLKPLLGTGPEHQEVNQAMINAIAVMKKAGATVEEIDDSMLDVNKINLEYDVQKWEFKPLFDAYLQSLGDATPVKSVSDFIATEKFDKSTLEEFLNTANNVEDPLSQQEYLARLAKLDVLRDHLLVRMNEANVDTVIYPLQKRLVVPIGELIQADRNGILAAMIGFPAFTVPIGYSQPTAQAPLGVPIGMDIMGKPFSEATLVKIAFAFEQATKWRKAPQIAPSLNLDFWKDKRTFS